MVRVTPGTLLFRSGHAYIVLSASEDVLVMHAKGNKQATVIFHGHGLVLVGRKGIRIDDGAFEITRIFVEKIVDPETGEIVEYDSGAERRSVEKGKS